MMWFMLLTVAGMVFWRAALKVLAIVAVLLLVSGLYLVMLDLQHLHLVRLGPPAGRQPTGDPPGRRRGPVAWRACSGVRRPGRPQQAGREHAASRVLATLTGGAAELTMDLAGPYPAAAGIRWRQRAVSSPRRGARRCTGSRWPRGAPRAAAAHAWRSARTGAPEPGPGPSAAPSPARRGTAEVTRTRVCASRRA